MKFLFMDETYMPLKAPGSATVLTGILVPALTHAEVRDQYHGLLSQVLPCENGTIPSILTVHAAALFPELGNNDAPRFAFFEGIVDICLQLNLSIYRFGYLNTKPMRNIFKTNHDTLGLCFLNFLFSLTDELELGPVWPVMESDHSPGQDLRFAGQIQHIEHYTNHLQSDAMSINNANLGELLYTTKRSSMGSLVDCVAYLRQATYLQALGHQLTPFKQRLANIGARLEPLVALDKVIEMKIRPAAEAH